MISLLRDLVLGAFLLLPARVAAAQTPAATWSCDATAGTLVIRYTPDAGEVKPPWPKARVLLFDSLLDLDRQETTVKGSRSKTIVCGLKSDRFEIKLEPGVPNVNLLGRCGDALTGVITVKRNGTTVLDEVEFENLNCHERERMLVRITFRDRSPEPALTYVGYDQP